MDRETAAALDREIMRMTAEEQNRLATDGGRVLKKTGTDEGKARNREYMRKYKARIALAAQRGIIQAGDNSGNR